MKKAFGRELPCESSRAPHYKISINKLLSHIKKTRKEVNGK